MRRVLIAAFFVFAGALASPAIAGATDDSTIACDEYSCPTTTVPIDPCPYNGNVPADDPTCPPPCEYDPELAADDPYCEPPTVSTNPQGTNPPIETIASTTTTSSVAPASTPSTAPTERLNPPVVGVGDPPVPPTTIVVQLPVTGAYTVPIAIIAALLFSLGVAMLIGSRFRARDSR